MPNLSKPKRRRAALAVSRSPVSKADGSAPGKAVVRQFKIFRAVVFRDPMRETIKFLHARNATFAMIAALMALQAQSDRSVSELAREIGLSLAATSQLIDRLVQDGLVGRTESPVDRRRKQLALTATGRGFLAAMDGAYSAAAERALGNVPTDALRALEAALAVVIAHVQRR